MTSVYTEPWCETWLQPSEVRPEKPVVLRGSVRPCEVSHRNSGNDRGRSPEPSQTSERDSMVFGFIIAYLGRPRRIIAHEDPTRREIYGRTRCNSPTETGRHFQINSGKRRHESGSRLLSGTTHTRKHIRTRVYVHVVRVKARDPANCAAP